MSPRLVSILAFLATAFVVNVWSSRRDVPARAPFEVQPPPGFQPIDRGAAAVDVSGEDPELAAARSKGGALFMHFGETEEDKWYTEVVDVHEDDFPLRPGDADRESMFPSARMEFQGHPVKLLESHVGKYGSNEAIAATLEAEVEKKPVRIFSYVMPTDKGRARVDAYCLAAEQAKYKPEFDRMITAAKGVAHRPERLAWYLVALLAAAVGAVAFAVTRFLQRANDAAQLHGEEEKLTHEPKPGARARASKPPADAKRRE